MYSYSLFKKGQVSYGLGNPFFAFFRHMRPLKFKSQPTIKIFPIATTKVPREEKKREREKKNTTTEEKKLERNLLITSEPKFPERSA